MGQLENVKTVTFAKIQLAFLSVIIMKSVLLTKDALKEVVCVRIKILKKYKNLIELDLTQIFIFLNVSF